MSGERNEDLPIGSIVPVASMLPGMTYAATKGFKGRAPLAMSGALHGYLLQPAFRTMREARLRGDSASYEAARKHTIQIVGAATVADMIHSASKLESMLASGVSSSSEAYRGAAKAPVLALSALLALDWVTRALRPRD